MAEVKLLTEAEWREVLAHTDSDDDVVHALNERGLIAPEPVDALLFAEAAEICRLHYSDLGEDALAEGYTEGGRYRNRNDGEINIALAALRRGLELAPAASPLTREGLDNLLEKAGLSKWLYDREADALHAALTEGQSK